MKNMLSIVSTLIIGSTLALTACGNKKPPTDPAATAAPADPAKPAPTAAEPKADDKPKEETTKGGW